MKKSILFILGALLIGSISYNVFLFTQNSQLKTNLASLKDKQADLEKTAEEYKAKNDSYENEISDLKSQERQIPPDWITHKNDKYGFQLSLPPSWKDYKIREYKEPFGEAVATYSIDLHSTEWNANVQMLILSIYTPASYRKDINQIPLSYNISGDYGTLLSENDYVVAYWPSPEAPEELKDLVKDIPEIVGTFTVFNIK